MNNGKIIEMNTYEEETVDRTPWLVSRQKELVTIIESIEAIASSKHWKHLEKNVFGGVQDAIDKSLRTARDDKELYRLQGQSVWCTKYMDFKTLAEAYRAELSGINKQLKN